MSVIDPDRHAELIAQQRELLEHIDALEAFDGPDEQRPAMRERLCAMAWDKEQALAETGLIEEHGYYQASQDLKRAARADMRSR